MGKKPKDEGFCNDCPFQEPGEQDKRCHRFPPVAVVAGGVFQWKLPQAKAGSWCGEHPARQESILDRRYEREAAREERE